MSRVGARINGCGSAPREPGLYDLKMTAASVPAPDDDAITLHVFVLVPASEIHDGMLNGYRIGTYPAEPLNGNPIYRPAGRIHRGHEGESGHEGLAALSSRSSSSARKTRPRRIPKYVVIDENGCR